MSKTARFVFIMMFVFGFLVVTPAIAKADLPLPIPEECQIYVDERSDYLLAVIGNYQDDLEFQKEQTQYWQEAHDRVAAHAVERNWEYAAEVEKNRKLTDKLGWKQSRLEYWRNLYRELKNK